MKKNIRYGVVNEVERKEYEKEWHLSRGYFFISRDKKKAIKICRNMKNSDFIVEMIYDEEFSNLKEEIYRSPDEKVN